MLRTIAAGFTDIGSAVKRHKVWIALAQEDIGDSHRRTMLGPAWLLINYLTMVATFIIILGRHMGIENYTAYVAVGLLVWNYISEIIGQGTTLFLRDESFIKGTVLPLSTYVLRQTMQSIIRSSYALVGCVAILLISGTPVTVGWLWAIPGILLVLATGPAAIVLFALAGAAFPDFQFIMNNLLRVLMFVTPIFWANPGGSAIRTILYHYNPMTYFLDIIRVPVLLGEFPVHAFAYAASISVLMWIVAIFCLGKFRRQIVFML